jgi:hypothetical protein
MLFPKSSEFSIFGSESYILTSLVKDKKLGRRSLAHVHSLASGLFRQAKQAGLPRSSMIGRTLRL